MRLEELTVGMSLNGLEPSAVATIVAVVPIAEGAVQLIYKTPDGTLKDRLLNRADESNISVATTERPWLVHARACFVRLAAHRPRSERRRLPSGVNFPTRDAPVGSRQKSREIRNSKKSEGIS